MATSTTKLGLSKPAGTDAVDIAVLNANSDKIDNASGTFICTSTTRPSTPYNGQTIYETDTESIQIYLAASSTWKPYLNPALFVPTGTIFTWPTNTAPTGFLLCDGTTYNNSTYTALSNVLGTTYGGSAGTTFAVPNMKGRTIVGRDAGQGEFDTLNEQGGEKAVTLTEAQMPSHVHQLFSGTGGGGLIANAGIGDIGNAQGQALATNTGAKGGGASHTNLQPYIVLNYIIRY